MCDTKLHIMIDFGKHGFECPHCTFVSRDTYHVLARIVGGDMDDRGMTQIFCVRCGKILTVKALKV